MSFELKVGQRYETEIGPIYEVENPQIINGQMTGLWLCRSLKTGGLLPYSPQGKVTPGSSRFQGLDFIKLIYDPSKTEESSEEDRKNKEELEALRKENAELKGEVESLGSASIRYEKACVENYELRKNIEELKVLLSNSKSSELKAQTDLNKTLDDFEKLEERIFVLKQTEKNLLDSLDNKTKIINRLQQYAKSFDKKALLWTIEKMELEDGICKLTDECVALELKTEKSRAELFDENTKLFNQIRLLTNENLDLKQKLTSIKAFLEPDHK